MPYETRTRSRSASRAIHRAAFDSVSARASAHLMAAAFSARLRFPIWRSAQFTAFFTEFRPQALSKIVVAPDLARHWPQRRNRYPERARGVDAKAGHAGARFRRAKRAQPVDNVFHPRRNVPLTGAVVHYTPR